MTVGNAPTRIGVAVAWLVALGLGVGLALAYDLSFAQVLHGIHDYIATSPYTLLLFVFFYSFLRPLIFLPSMWLAIASGSLFGFWPGVLCSLLGENLSATTAYAIARYFRGGPAAHDQAAGSVSKFRHLLYDQTFPTVLVMRAAYLPFDPVNYGCGLLRVPWWPYFLGTLIGTLVPTLTFVSFGASVDFTTFVLNIDKFDPAALLDATQLIISFLLFAASAVIAWIAYQRHHPG